MSKRQRSDDETSSSDDNTQDEDNKGNKYLHIDTSSQNHKPVIYCSLAPHARSLPFLSYEDYEIHYLKDHSNRCSDCNKNFPTQHFLQLHIGENHDPINEARRAKGEKTYACFVEGCDKVCLEPRKRRMHLIDKHMFPKNYDFFIVDDGLDPSKRGSMLRPEYRRGSRVGGPKSGKSRDVGVDNGVEAGAPKACGVNHGSDQESQSATPSPDAELAPLSAHSHKEEDVDMLTSSISALRFVPSSVRFGRHGRGGFSQQ